MSTDPKKSNGTRNVVAATLGNAMEFYDFTVYAMFATVIGTVFFPSTDPHVSLLLSITTFGVGFIARPIGGVVIGIYADRYGRKSAMTVTIWMMALGSGLIGLSPTYAQAGLLAPAILVFARLLQGFSAGGEMGASTTFLIESAPPHRQGFFGSWQFASQNIGSAISGIIGVGFALVLSTDDALGWGWRIPFLFGILIAPLGFYIRRKLPETLHAEKALSSMSEVFFTLIRSHRMALVLCVMIISGVTTTQYFFLYAATFAIATLGYSSGWAMGISLAIAATGTVFSVIGGILSDRYGLKRVILTARIIITVLAYPALLLALSSGSPVILAVILSVLMVFHAISTACAIVLIPKAFPETIRTAGLSISYAFSVAVFGGTAQIIFTWLIGYTGDKLSFVPYILILSVGSILATAALKTNPDLRVAPT